MRGQVRKRPQSFNATLDPEDYSVNPRLINPKTLRIALNPEPATPKPILRNFGSEVNLANLKLYGLWLKAYELGFRASAVGC